MAKSSTKIIFLWHMHQPHYKSPERGTYILPWVRLHGVKDYYGMARVVDKFDKVKVVFNFSGVLLKQLLDYAYNYAGDYYLTLTLRNPAYLNRGERAFIINRFFSVNFERFIKPQARYLQLYNKKLSSKGKLTPQEIGDLQALFNLCWFHPYTIKEDKNLKNLILKERGYTDEDKKYIIKKQYEVIAQILPLLKGLLSEKRIELSVTPYHHPILPLIYDTDILKDSPYLKRPSCRFTSPSHCRWQLRQAKETFKDIFGYLPQGSWPAEGGVSQEAAGLYAEEGFKWIGTDEAILFKSLASEHIPYEMIKNQRQLIYRPYKFKGVRVFFRDRNISDAISFIYQGWEDPLFAAQDLLEHFKRTHYYVKDIFRQRVITVIMDGENAWEYYKNNGVEFLETVYANLEKSPILSSATPQDILKKSSPKKLTRLASGSWINGDFGVWAGSQKNNSYWHILNRLKQFIEKSKKDKSILEEAKNCLYLLEGSDWFWWNTFEDISGEFKKIFLSYAGKIYNLLGKKPPSYLK